LTAKFRKTAELFVTTSLFMALNSVLIVYFCARLYEINVPLIIPLQIFFTNIAVYNLNKVTDKTEDKINRPNQTTKFQKYFIGFIIPAIICYAITLTSGIINGIAFFFVLLPPLLIGFAYSVKIFKNVPRLKEIQAVKSLAVTFSLTLAFTVLPALTATVAPEKIALVFGYIFIQLFINVTIFDLIDIPGDKVANIKTIPTYLGKNGTTRFLYIINSLSLIWLSICLTNNIFTKYLPIAAFGILYNYILIWYFTKNTHKRFLAEIIVDSEGILIAAILWLTIR